MIVDKDPNVRRVILLKGPEGNAFCLMGYDRRWARQLHKDGNAIIKEMMEGDYENLLQVFDREFGKFVTLVR